MIRKIIKLTTALALAAQADASAAQAKDATWCADLVPLNTGTGRDADGTVTLTVLGDRLTIRIETTCTAQGIMHLQHFHCFTEDIGHPPPRPEKRYQW